MSERMFPNPPEEPMDRQAEVMPMPEIVFREERGSQLVSVLLRADNPAKDASDPFLAEGVNSLFESNQECQAILAGFRNIRATFHIEDEETLYRLALASSKPERLPYALAMIHQHKPWVTYPEKAAQQVQSLLVKLELILAPTELTQKLKQHTQQDLAQRELSRNDLETRLKRHVDFFRPAVETTRILQVNYAPSDPLQPKHAGYAAMFGDEQVVVSHIENADNQEHEFLHGIVNPMTRKLAEQLAEKEKERIVSLAAPSLRPDYGDDWESLLNEELIRAYTEEYQHDADKMRQDTLDRISRLDEETFRALQRDPQRQTIFTTLGVVSLEDLKAKAGDLYEYQQRERHHGLRVGILGMYQAYADRDDKKVNFEMFLSQKLRELIRK